MAPSEREIVDGIYAAIKNLHSSDPDTLTVRNVRNKAEADLRLETGLLSNESWKDKSKKIIKDYAVCSTVLKRSNVGLMCVGRVNWPMRLKNQKSPLLSQKL